MKHIYRNIYRRLSNFQLAFFAGQGCNYLLRSPLLSIRQNEKIIKTIDYNDLSVSIEKVMKLYHKKTWKELYLIEINLIDKGEYLKAYFVRLLSQKCAVKYYETGKVISNKVLLIWGLFFEGKGNIAEGIINKRLKYPYLKLTKSKLCILHDIISGVVQKDYLKGKFSQYDLGLHNRNVTIAGPLSEKDCLENLSEGEVSIQINYFKKENKKDPDISFYNGKILESIASGKRLLPELSCYVFHRFVYEFQKCLIRDSKARLTYRSDYLFGLGQPNMLPNVLFQLIAMKPNEIRVNGFNLYMSKSVYNNSYLDYNEKERDVDTLKSLFSQHNIISQYLFIDVLYKKGFIKVDKRLKEIFDDGVECYLRNMKNLINGNNADR